MMKRIILLILVTLLLVGTLPAFAHAEGFDASLIEEPYFIVVDAANPSQTLLGLARGADERIFPASTTKIITCIIALEYAVQDGHSLDEQVAISAAAVDFTAGNSLMEVEKGEVYLLEELLYGLMLISGNDAAVAIAEHIGGSIAGFAELMNAKAREIGMGGTNFVNPHGKHNNNHYSTARDMAVLTGYALRDPEFIKICKTGEYTATEIKSGRQVTVRNTNRLIANPTATDENPDPISCLYDKAIGVKTGDTNQAGKCLVAAAEYHGMRVIAVLMGGTLQDADYTANWSKWRAPRKEPYNARRFQDAILLFDYAFDALTSKITIGELVAQGLPATFTLQIENYSENDPTEGLLTLTPDWDENTQLMLMAPTQAALLASLTHCAQERYYKTAAPVYRGEVVGVVEYTVNGSVLLTANLIAPRDVQEGIIVTHTPDASGQPILITDGPTKDIGDKPFPIAAVIIVFFCVLIVLTAALLIRRRIVINRRKQEALRRKRKEMARREMQRQTQQRRPPTDRNRYDDSGY
ncbi:MAG: D-alanyl-D-alanine carboxypeptidase [Clostridiales bacterium]|nr:D-alanyl-D-alanine carboxypeptidase [Clostridiales bacterium]